MNEPQIDTPLRHHISVDTARIKHPNFEIRLDETHPTEITRGHARHLYDKHMSDKAAPFLAENIQPNERLVHGIALARQTINELRQKMGLPPVPEENMSVLLLNPENYKKLSLAIDPNDNNIPDAFTIDGIDSVIVQHNENYPDYLTSGIIFHELVHQWLERRVHVFGTEADKTETQYRRLSSEERRHGMRTKILGPDGNYIWSGMLLNEIGNYYAQKVFTDRISAEPSVFSEEIANQKQLLQTLFSQIFLPDIITIPLELKTPNGTKETGLKFDKTNIYFSNNNELLFGVGLLLQLGTDLTRLCGNVDGKPFGDLLLEAKTNPMVENTVKATIDTHMGDGFYDKIRIWSNATENHISLLLAVQSKLYPTTSS